MSVVKHFIEDSIKKTEIDEFLQNEFERAGYGGVSITKTPLGTHLVIYTMRPGLVIGRGGETIRALATVLEEKFQLPSPQISVAEIEIPELNAYVVASRIASALKRGVHYRRAGFWGLNQAMEAGALGAEVIISGKLRTDRARYEKFREGYLPKSGEPPRKYMRKAELHVQLKPGILGVKVRLIPPEAEFPDQVKIQIIEEESDNETGKEIVEETVVAKEKVTKPEVLPADEKVVVEEKAAPPVEKKVVTEKKVVKTKAQPVAKKTLEKKKVEKKVAEPKVSPAKEKVVPKEKAAKPAVTPVKTKKVAETKTPSVAKKPVAAKKVEAKVAEPAVTPAKKKKVAKKKVVKTKAPSAKKKKEAGE
jgi:small subunit ribosomal protein S3